MRHASDRGAVEVSPCATTLGMEDKSEHEFESMMFFDHRPLPQEHCIPMLVEAKFAGWAGLGQVD
jgi:hypothetical protein